MYERSNVKIIAERMCETENQFLQVVLGPRQTGKSTMIAQALAKVNLPAHSVSADDVLAPDVGWIQTEWQQARNMAQQHATRTILVLDEIQKVKGWLNAVKGLWDAGRRTNIPLKVVLSG